MLRKSAYFLCVLLAAFALAYFLRVEPPPDGAGTPPLPSPELAAPLAEPSPLAVTTVPEAPRSAGKAPGLGEAAAELDALVIASSPSECGGSR